MKRKYLNVLYELKFHSSVELIGSFGFYGCTSLNEVIFSSDSHLREIYGFGGYTSLCRIEIPSSVERIRYSGFIGCIALRVVTIHTGCRMKENRGLRNVKPFIVQEEDEMKEHRRRIHLAVREKELK
jgi:hypothetical protein